MKRSFDEANDDGGAVQTAKFAKYGLNSAKDSTISRETAELLNYKKFPSCSICNTTQYVIEDNRNGCVVCTNCGTQIGGQIISEGAEWRTFADDNSKGGADPSRVGGIDNHIRGLGTTMSGGGSLSHRHNQATLSSDQQTIDRVLRLASQYQIRMGLEKQIFDEAAKICQQVVEAPIELRGKSLKQDTLAAVCIYLACRNKRQDRKKSDVIEIANVNEKAFNKQFQRVHGIIHKLSATSGDRSELQSVIPRSYASHFVESYGNMLKFHPDLISVAKCVILTAGELDIMGSAQPANLAIAALYFVYLIEKPPSLDIQEKLEKIGTLKVDTLIKLTKLFYDKRLQLVPTTFCSMERVEKMSRPEKQKKTQA